VCSQLITLFMVCIVCVESLFLFFAVWAFFSFLIRRRGRLLIFFIFFLELYDNSLVKLFSLVQNY
jgi:hypothetical protein